MEFGDKKLFFLKMQCCRVVKHTKDNKGRLDLSSDFIGIWKKLFHVILFKNR